MRTIKFRGRRIDNNEWVHGYLYKFKLPNGEACMILTEDNIHIDNSLEPKYHLAFTLWVDLFIIDPGTVGQFTGLFDKNGKEIYEGDIVEYYELKTYCINPDCEPHLLGYGQRLVKVADVVEFKNGMFGVDNEDYRSFAPLDDIGLMDYEKETLDEEINDPYFDAHDNDVENLESIIGIRVIGNIHDNPNMIEL